LLAAGAQHEGRHLLHLDNSSTFPGNGRAANFPARFLWRQQAYSGGDYGFHLRQVHLLRSEVLSHIDLNTQSIGFFSGL
jgi:hypothetical protein